MSYTPLDESSEHGFNNKNGGSILVDDYEGINDYDNDIETTAEAAAVHSPSTSNSKTQPPILNKELSEPLTNGRNSNEEEGDPFYVFRDDLYRKLELVDESLAEYLRVVHQTVRCTHFM
jgi:hypothetical protein